MLIFILSSVIWSNSFSKEILVLEITLLYISSLFIVSSKPLFTSSWIKSNSSEVNFISPNLSKPLEDSSYSVFFLLILMLKISGLVNIIFSSLFLLSMFISSVVIWDKSIEYEQLAKNLILLYFFNILSSPQLLSIVTVFVKFYF